MKRRSLLKHATYLALSGLLPGRRLYAAPAGYSGRLLIALEAGGGWDVTSFCDPKQNIPGEFEINHWAQHSEPLTAGNISYAPFANNRTFFDRYHQHMLVINGVDSQTNSHDTGSQHSWSGRNAEGFPSLTALFAAHQAPDLPLSYLSFGGYSSTANLIQSSVFTSLSQLRELVDPNFLPDSARTYRLESETARRHAAQLARLNRLLASPEHTPLQRENLLAYRKAISNKDSLKSLAEFLPEEDQLSDPVTVGDGQSSLLPNIELALSAFQAGVACACDFSVGEFDTHSDHDFLQNASLAHLTDAIDHLWQLAAQRGIADRLTLLVGSDFGRTPFYNSSDDGKDHWPIGSWLVMENNPPWGNRVVGLTDTGHNAHKINPDTLQRDDSGGTIIYPKHVHKALRRHLGLENTAVTANFPFTGVEEFDFFNPGKSTA